MKNKVMKRKLMTEIVLTSVKQQHMLKKKEASP